MEKRQFKYTALTTAYYRAYHALYDSPKIFDDQLAYHFLTEEERRSFEQFLLGSLRSNDPARASLFPDPSAALKWIIQSNAGTPISLSRNRYAEDTLAHALRQGARQYVNLGAGMDTFAFRRPEVFEQIEIFEVDHPDTQAFKRSRLTQLKWKQPDKLHFVPVDFTRESIAEALRHSAFDPKALSFFSWMGAAMYLTWDEVYATLRAVANIAPAGSMVVFDYLDTDAFIPQKAAPRVYGMIEGLRIMGEPLLHTGFDPLTLAPVLAPLGLHLREDLSPWDITLRYFMGRTDHYRATEHAHIACAVVG